MLRAQNAVLRPQVCSTAQAMQGGYLDAGAQDHCHVFTCCVQHFDDAFKTVQQADVKGATTQVKHKDGCSFRWAAQAMRKSCSNRLCRPVQEVSISKQICRVQPAD